MFISDKVDLKAGNTTRNKEKTIDHLHLNQFKRHTILNLLHIKI